MKEPLSQIAGLLLLAAFEFTNAIAAGPSAKELAVLDEKMTVKQMAFSKDGSRLVILNVGPKVILWAASQPTTIINLPSPPPLEDHFGIAKMTPNGKIAVAGGRTQLQAWDCDTGKSIGGPIMGPQFGRITAAAVSPDGRFVAIASNEMDKDFQNAVKPFPVGEISVWEVRSGKLRWRLPGDANEETWSGNEVSNLVFAPDARRLAVVRESYPLHMLELEEGSDPPNVVPRLNRQLRSSNFFEGIHWLPNGRRILANNSTAIENWDASTLERKSSFQLPYKRASTDPPTGFEEKLSAMSADGTRLVIHLVRYIPEKSQRENRLVLFDVRDRAVLGRVELAPESYTPGARIIGKTPRGDIGSMVYFGSEGDSRIAISGDGHRVAYAPQGGPVRVFDVANLGGDATSATESEAGNPREKKKPEAGKRGAAAKAKS
ncbi:MAG: WD40 repeat domain-containing protein [Pirellulaceae bacterium]|nr:WD40 repeat domain-containing protein [Pirellulaceae bacterium]